MSGCMQNKQQNKSHQITNSGNSLLKAKTPGFNVLERLFTCASQLRSSNNYRQTLIFVVPTSCVDVY